MEEEYEITPHKEIEKLRHELEEIKKHSVVSDSRDELHRSIKELTIAIRSLTNLFHVAAKEITQGEEKEREVEKRFDPLIHKMNMLIDQNKKIAAGIVSVADMIREKLEDKKPEFSEAPAPEPSQPAPPPSFPEMPGPAPGFPEAPSAPLPNPSAPPGFPGPSPASPPQQGGLDFGSLNPEIPPPPKLESPAQDSGKAK